jgi:glyoxylase-like metal-dependent hydrolase (beta-lactamase superfamily II)
LTQSTITTLKALAGTRQPRILLTSREGHGRLRRLQEQLDWPVLVQEQEAYLLPNVERLECFKDEHTTASGLRLLWTPGPTPGSAVVLAPAPVELLFCGRLLTPLAPGMSRTVATWPHISLASPARKLDQIAILDSPRSQSRTGFWGCSWGVAWRAFSALLRVECSTITP